MKKPGGRGKSQLPPRSPGAGRLPRLDNVQISGVLEALRQAGWNGHGAHDGQDDLAIIDVDFLEVMIEHRIEHQITELIRFYLFERHAQEPKVFRTELGDFGKLLAKFISGMEAVGPAVEVALKNSFISTEYDVHCSFCENQLDSEDYWDDRLGFDRLRRDLERLQRAANAVSVEESGAGRDSNRPAHTLIRGLAEIYALYAKCEPTRRYNETNATPYGPFWNFLNAVNEQIPADYRLSDVDHLVRIFLEGQSTPAN